MKIKTYYEPKPIPTARFDWSAYDDSTYDGEGCPIGHGSTEAAAIADLLLEIELLRPEMFDEPLSQNIVFSA